MKKIVIDIPDEIYERTMVIVEKLNISFDEFCTKSVEELAKEHLEEEKENKNS
ncbi:MAG: hypothetical protein ACR2L1_11115 [Pyrinomonadaceae bacterium]